MSSILLTDDLHVWGELQQMSAGILAHFNAGSEHYEAIPPQRLAIDAAPCLLGELQEWGVDTSLAQQLNQVFAEALGAAARACEEAFSQEVSNINRGDTMESMEAAVQTCQAVRTIYLRAFASTIRGARKDILNSLRSTVPSEDRHGAQEAGEHTPQAVALLSEAWERSQKPNAVERKRLAAATGLSSHQVAVWFNNRRQRGNKPYLRKRGSVSSGGKSKGLRAAREDAPLPIAPTPTRKVSSTPSLSSSTSSSYDYSPLQSFATPESIDRYLSGLRTPSPTPFPLPQQQQQQQQPYAHHDYFSAYPIPMLDTQKPTYIDPLSLLQQQHELDLSSQVTFPQNPTFDFSMPTPVVPRFEQVQLPQYDASLLSDSSLDFDLSVGVGDDFWASIMETAGMQPLASSSQEQVSLEHMQQDQLPMLAGQPGCVIAPAADDWSHKFSTMDFSAFGQPQPLVQQEQ